MQMPKIGTCVIARYHSATYMEIALTYRENCHSLNNTWSLPGGQVDDNELFLTDAMQRELKEETGLTLVPVHNEVRHIDLIGVQQELIDGVLWLNFVFTGFVQNRDELVNKEPHKFREVRWIRWDPQSPTLLDSNFTPLSHITQEALITFRHWYIDGERRMPFKTVAQAVALDIQCCEL